MNRRAVIGRSAASAIGHHWSTFQLTNEAFDQQERPVNGPGGSRHCRPALCSAPAKPGLGG
jgi:hypothetical protein